MNMTWLRQTVPSKITIPRYSSSAPRAGPKASR